MALCTRIVKADGEPLPLPHGWGWWHVERMVDVIRAEVPTLADANSASVLDHCPYTVVGEHTFTDEVDGEVLVIMPGMVLDAYRDR